MPIDLTRSVLVVLIPGAVGVAPWLLWLVLHTGATLGYQEKYTWIANAVGFSIAAIAGLTFESIGTWLEVRWDKERESTYQVRENWFAYLAATPSREPVGYRYLSRLATTFYFELSMMMAIIPFAAGVGFLLAYRFPQTACFHLLALAVCTIALLAYFWINARQTHEVLCITRKELNGRLKKQEGAAAPSGP